jgi:hypothetical protein
MSHQLILGSTNIDLLVILMTPRAFIAFRSLICFTKPSLDGRVIGIK